MFPLGDVQVAQGSLMYMWDPLISRELLQLESWD